MTDQGPKPLPHITAILLAAGQSRRMGAQKLLLPYAGKTVVRHIADQLKQTSISHLIAVVGADRDRVSQALADTSATLVINNDPEGDMLSSVRCGLRAAPADCDAFLVALGDQPAITPDLINAILQAYHPAAHDIIIPTFNARRGHPILFSARYRHEILTQFEGHGLRGLLAVHPQNILEFPSKTDLVLSDMDYPQDYRRELERG